MFDDLNIQVCFEFLDGAVAFVFIPAWLQSSKSLITQKPGTMEETYVHFTKQAKGGMPIYREWPPAKVIRFPLDRRLKTM